MKTSKTSLLQHWSLRLE